MWNMSNNLTRWRILAFTEGMAGRSRIDLPDAGVEAPGPIGHHAVVLCVSCCQGDRARHNS